MNSKLPPRSRLQSGEFRPENDISEALQTLLRLRPCEVEIQSEMILTTSPKSWNKESIGKQTTIVDLSSLLGVASTWSVSESAFEVYVAVYVVEMFVEAGWPREAIICQYRPNLKSRFITYISIFGSDQIWQMAIKVKGSKELNSSDSQSLIESLLRETTARWLCITDGSKFKLISRETNERQTLERPPSLSEVGITEWITNPRKLAEQSFHLLKPSSVEELLTEVTDRQPEALVIDFTIPWGMRVGQDSRFREAMFQQVSGILPVNTREFPRERMEVLSMLLAWAATIPSIKNLSTIVPAGITTNPSNQWLRKSLARELRLCSVVELPADIFRPIASVVTNILYFGGEREHVYFDVLASRGDLIGIDSRPWFDSLSKWMKGNEPSTGYTARSENLTSWAVRANDPEIERILERLRRLGEILPLGELCDIYRGVAIGREVEDSEEGIALVNAKNLRGGYLNLEDIRKIKVHSIPERALLKFGDLLLPEMSAEFSFVLNKSSETAILSSSVIVLRLRDNRASAEYLLEYLNSSTAKKLIAARSSILGNLHRIFPHSLYEFPVPVVDPQLFQGLSNIQQIEAELRTKADELESLRRSLFDAQNSHVFQDKLIELKRHSNILSTSLRSAERLEFQIANFYPFPLAYGFRLLESIVTPAELYKEQLRIAENLLAFLGSVSLALLQEQDRQETEIAPKQYWRGGISPGHWKDIIARSAKVFATYKDDPLAASIYKLNIGSDKKGFGQDVAALIRAKNDFKHDRGPVVEAEIIKAVQDTQERLKRCMEALAFFTEYPIRQVLDVNPSRRGSKVNLKCLRFIGDHPGLPQEEIHFHTALHKSDLFLDAGRQEWVPLYPFISAMNCPTCKARETYFIDKWDNGVAYTKSFERGHTESSSEISDALAEWGGNE